MSTLYEYFEVMKSAPSWIALDTWAPDHDTDWLQIWNEGTTEWEIRSEEDEEDWDTGVDFNMKNEEEEDWDKGIFLAGEKKKEEEEDKAKKEKAKKDQEKATDKEEDWKKQIRQKR